MPEIRERDKADQLKRKDKQPREKKSIGAPVKRSLRAAIGRNIRRQGNNSSQAESTAAADAHAAQQVQQAAESIMPRSVDAAQRMKYAFQQQRKKEAERYTHVTEEAPPVSESTSLSPVKQRQPPTSSTKPASTPMVSIRERPKGSSSPKVRQETILKTRQSAEWAPRKTVRPTKADLIIQKVSTSAQVTERGRCRFQRSTQRQLAQASKQSSKRAAQLAKQAAAAVTKAVKAVIGMLAGVVGAPVLLVAVYLPALVAAIAASPFGIFFSGGSSAHSVPLSSAVAQINLEYSNRLAELQEGDYDRIQMQGNPPDWREVAAVFASHTAGTEDGMDVSTLDEARVELLRMTFWDMCAISSEVETIDHPDSDPTDEVNDSYTERVLQITITAKTAGEMRTVYAFTEYQNEALDALLSQLDSLNALLGNLDISQTDAVALLKNLPADLSPERRAVVRHALSLVGKVNYFWGGKSRVLGWDSRWGQLQLVWAEGSETTGTYRPFGLDCSGFVDWVFYNASGGEYLIGHSGGAYSQHTYCTDIPWSEAQPGDLVFYPEDEHVGIVGGWDESGNLLIIHCTSGSHNNVVITRSGGFVSIAKPLFYGGG